ncbi:hypothetical protein UY3_12376 [Chelonia mydas]|uniref:Uncharacterized protein n=1 Tax=Chelonia mydas TaxID=8469 RepID=M7BQU0_CHEMY|nr:hypothetical protein UY3_12376 [Chelonia mydas]
MRRFQNRRINCCNILESSKAGATEVPASATCCEEEEEATRGGGCSLPSPPKVSRDAGGTVVGWPSSSAAKGMGIGADVWSHTSASVDASGHICARVFIYAVAASVDDYVGAEGAARTVAAV